MTRTCVASIFTRRRIVRVRAMRKNTRKKLRFSNDELDVGQSPILSIDGNCREPAQPIADLILLVRGFECDVVVLMVCKNRPCEHNKIARVVCEDIGGPPPALSMQRTRLCKSSILRLQLSSSLLISLDGSPQSWWRLGVEPGHSASFQPLDKNAPSNIGTKHLVSGLHFKK
jgi:hypothetical protein